jgi:hypothetical protein
VWDDPVRPVSEQTGNIFVLMLFYECTVAGEGDVVVEGVQEGDDHTETSDTPEKTIRKQSVSLVAPKSPLMSKFPPMKKTRTTGRSPMKKRTLKRTHPKMRKNSTLTTAMALPILRFWPRRRGSILRVATRTVSTLSLTASSL